MTNQSPETIIYEGVEYDHRCYILEQVKPKIEFHPTGNFYWHGVHGAWEIRNNKLYFVDLIAWRHKTNSRRIVLKIRVDDEAELYMNKREGFDLQEYALQDIFPGAPADGVFADWFNGELAIPSGGLDENKKYTHFLAFKFSKGVTQSKVIKPSNEVFKPYEHKKFMEQLQVSIDEN